MSAPEDTRPETIMMGVIVLGCLAFLAFCAINGVLSSVRP